MAVLRAQVDDGIVPDRIIEHVDSHHKNHLSPDSLGVEVLASNGSQRRFPKWEETADNVKIVHPSSPKGPKIQASISGSPFGQTTTAAYLSRVEAGRDPNSN